MNKKVKICIASIYAFDFFCPRDDSLGRVGGAEMQLYNLAIKLAEDSRFEIHFFVGNFGGPKFEKIKNVNVYKIFDVSKTKIIFNFIKLWFVLKRINFDICLQRSAGIETGLMALYCKLNKKKIVYMMAHDQDASVSVPKYLNNNFFLKIRWKLFKIALRRAVLIFSQNKYQQEKLLENYKRESILRNNAHIIDNSISSFEKKNILWVGRADKNFKQPEYFLKLAKRFKNYKFIMICQKSADLNYFNEIKELSKNIKNLEFIEYVPTCKMEKYFSEALIFVNTSISEGFPNTFIESFKNKAVVISLNVNPNDILDSGIGFCAKGDFEFLADKLSELLNDNEFRQIISDKAFNYVKDNHDIKKIIEKDKKYLLEILN